MTKGRRAELLVYHGQAVNNLNRCLADLDSMFEMYKEGYPEQTIMISTFAEGVIQIRDLLIQFREQSM